MSFFSHSKHHAAPSELIQLDGGFAVAPEFTFTATIHDPDVGPIRVAGEVRVAKDVVGDRPQLRDGRADDLREGVMIAPPGSLDEFPLVHGHPR